MDARSRPECMSFLLDYAVTFLGQVQSGDVGKTKDEKRGKKRTLALGAR